MGGPMPGHALGRIRSIAFRPPLEPDAADELGRILDGFVANGEWPVVPYVAALAFSTDRLTREAAAVPIANLVGRVPVAELATLDRALRRGGWFTDFFTSAWWELRPGALPRVGRSDPTFLPLTRLALSHPNGGVRAAALERIAERPAAIDVPFLLLRAVDWVAALGAAAAEALLPFLAVENAVEVAALLPLFDRVAGRARLGPAVRAAVDEVLASPAGRGALLADTRSPDPLRRRAAHRRLLVDGDRQLLARALGDRDVPVRLLALARLRELGLVADMGSILRGDPLGSVRAVGLGALGPGSPVHVAAYLGDRSARVRRVAHELLRARGDDVQRRAREAVAGARGRRLAAALSALARVAGPDDDALGRAHLGATSIAVRVAALRVVVAAGGIGALAGALADPAPAVVRAAVRLVRTAGDWQALALLLAAPPGRAVTTALARWMRCKVRTPPSGDELAAARVALASARLEPIARAALHNLLDS